MALAPAFYLLSGAVYGAAAVGSGAFGLSFGDSNAAAYWAVWAASASLIRWSGFGGIYCLYFFLICTKNIIRGLKSIKLTCLILFAAINESSLWTFYKFELATMRDLLMLRKDFIFATFKDKLISHQFDG